MRLSGLMYLKKKPIRYMFTLTSPKVYIATVLYCIFSPTSTPQFLYKELKVLEHVLFSTLKLIFNIFSMLLWISRSIALDLERLVPQVLTCTLNRLITKSWQHRIRNSNWQRRDAILVGIGVLSKHHKKLRSV